MGATAEERDSWLGPRPPRLQGLAATRVAACPMCGSFRRTRYGDGYARCRACRTVYADPRLSDDVVVRRLDEFAPATVDDSPDARAAAIAAEGWKRQLVLDLVPAPGRRLLDIGTGSGAFPAAMAEAGWQAEGQDLSPAVARAASARFGLPVHAAPIGELPGVYDVITMWDTLEHAVSPHAMLEDCAGLLVAGGALVILSPHSAGISARLLGRRWWVYGPSDHIVMFSVPALRDGLDRAGFGIVHLHTRQLAPPYPPERLDPDRPLTRLHARVTRSARFERALTHYGLGDWILAIATSRAGP